MKVVIQRVRRAAVTVGGETVASVGRGLLALVGVAEGDGQEEALRLARKCAELRIFADAEGKWAERRWW
jgi:D-tyrosyl-tRNA(Tyr) deacylase